MDFRNDIENKENITRVDIINGFEDVIQQNKTPEMEFIQVLPAKDANDYEFIKDDLNSNVNNNKNLINENKYLYTYNPLVLPSDKYENADIAINNINSNQVKKTWSSMFQSPKKEDQVVLSWENVNAYSKNKFSLKKVFKSCTSDDSSHNNDTIKAESINSVIDSEKSSIENQSSESIASTVSSTERASHSNRQILSNGD